MIIINLFLTKKQQHSKTKSMLSCYFFFCLMKPIIIHLQFTLLEKEHNKMIQRNRYNNVGSHSRKIKNIYFPFSIMFVLTWCSCNVLFAVWWLSVGAGLEVRVVLDRYYLWQIQQQYGYGFPEYECPALGHFNPTLLFNLHWRCTEIAPLLGSTQT